VSIFLNIVTATMLELLILEIRKKWGMLHCHWMVG